MNGRSVLSINPLLLNAFHFISVIISSYCNVRQYHSQNCPFTQTLRYNEKDNLANISVYPSQGHFCKDTCDYFSHHKPESALTDFEWEPGLTKGSLIFLNQVTIIELRVNNLVIYWNLTCEFYTFCKTVNTIGTMNHRIPLCISIPPLTAYFLLHQVSEQLFDQYNVWNCCKSDYIGWAYEASPSFPSPGEDDSWVCLSAASPSSL